MIPAATSGSADGMVFAASSFITMPEGFDSMSAIVGLKPAAARILISPAASRILMALPPFVTSLGMATTSPALSSLTDFTFF